MTRQHALYSTCFKDVEGILFDLDYTLINFGEAKRKAVDRAIKEMINVGLPIPYSEAKRQIYRIYKQNGIEYQLVFDDFVSRLNLSRTQKNKIWAAAVHGYRETRRRILTTYPHTIPTLVELTRRGYQFGIISDATEKEVWLRIFDTNLQPYFKVVVTLDEDGLKKPHPQVFRKAVRELDLISEKVIMIGDNPPYDLAGAKKLGIKTIWAKYGIQDISELDDAEKLVFYTQQQDPDDPFQIPDAEIDDIQELLDLLPTVE